MFSSASYSDAAKPGVSRSRSPSTGLSSSSATISPAVPQSSKGKGSSLKQKIAIHVFLKPTLVKFSTIDNQTDGPSRVDTYKGRDYFDTVGSTGPYDDHKHFVNDFLLPSLRATLPTAAFPIPANFEKAVEIGGIGRPAAKMSSEALNQH
ncbi:hypothetical protein BD408DRAFT_427490 [Parasitella parasitica]|nr:hypothetical protein BD408DRAFT_427490 [Parasitella parasitica]